ncbi:hypothetical protein ASG68_22510 [Rhizobium sp. Leaf453]|nr:hypothetical protein ASG68_22510 [Rhizobium sp. Leaf453]
MCKFILSSVGQRPPYYEVAEHLWGVGCNIDSDGNSSTPDATDWTELTLSLRPDNSQRVDIDPIITEGLLNLSIKAEIEDLAHRAALFLRDRAGGLLIRTE